jgi:hypothetical protein
MIGVIHAFFTVARSTANGLKKAFESTKAGLNNRLNAMKVKYGTPKKCNSQALG